MAIDYETTLKDRNAHLVELARHAARDQYEASIRQPGGLAEAVWEWDSGDDTTALTAYPTKRVGIMKIRFPCVATEWHIAAYPSGSAIVNLMKAEDGVALASATSMVTGVKPTLSSAEEASLVLTPVSVGAKARLYALLESVSTIRNLTLTLTLQRVPA